MQPHVKMDKKSAFDGHGGNLLAFAKYFGKKEDEIIDFSSNVNPLGISERLQMIYQASMNDLSVYPDADSHEFCERIASCFSLRRESVVAGNGSMALLEVAIRMLAPKQSLVIEPSFTEYRRLLRLYGSQIDPIVLSPREGFQFPLRSILERLSKNDLLILGHPNNPTGFALGLEEIQVLLEEAQKKSVFVMIDEAFVDWEPSLSFVHHVRNWGHLLIVRSMTKFFALAGIRAGFALGAPPWMKRMQNYLGPWNCNRLAQKLSVAALSDMDFQEKSRNWLRMERAWLCDAIEQIGEFKVFPSHANFLLVQSRKPLDGFFDDLGSHGIYVRMVSDFIGLGPSYFRIAVRTRKDNEFLIAALNSWAKAR